MTKRQKPSQLIRQEAIPNDASILSEHTGKLPLFVQRDSGNFPMLPDYFLICVKFLLIMQKLIKFSLIFSKKWCIIIIE